MKSESVIKSRNLHVVPTEGTTGFNKFFPSEHNRIKIMVAVIINM